MLTIVGKKINKSAAVKHLLKKMGIIDIESDYDRMSKLESILHKEIIYFDFSLTSPLILVLILARHIFGYRFVINEEIGSWEEIKDSKKYLVYGVALIYNHIGIDNLKEVLKNNKKSLIEKYIEFIKLDFEKKNFSKHRFAFVDPDKENYLMFIAALQLNFGQLFIAHCSIDNISLPKNKDSLLILNAEKLGKQKQAELYHELLTGEYKEKLVIVIDSIPIELEGYPQFKQWLIVSDNEITDLLNKELYRTLPVIEKINEEADKFMYLTRHIVSNVKDKQRQLAIIEQLTVMGRNLYVDVINFWYDYNLIKTDEMESWEVSTEKEYDKYLLNKKFIENVYFKLSHNKSKKIWIIEKDGTIVKEIPYSRSKGIKYIAYLEKYYKEKTISDVDLRRVVDKWHGKSSKTAEVSTDAKKIRQDLIYFFEKQCPILAPVNECMEISSKANGCYFRNNTKIILEIIDEDIPDPIC